MLLLSLRCGQWLRPLAWMGGLKRSAQPSSGQFLWSHLGRWSVGLLLGVLGGISLGEAAAIAQLETTANASTAPSAADSLLELLKTLPSSFDDLNLLVANGVDEDIINGVTDADVSLFEMTNPSLWWSRDQLPTCWNNSGPPPADVTLTFNRNRCWRQDNTSIRINNYRLIRRWQAFQHQESKEFIIDFQVDPQYWNRLSYLQQYAVLNQLGSSGLSYGYQVRIYSAFRPVGIHACDLQEVRQRTATFAKAQAIELDLSAVDEIECRAAIGPFIQPILVFEDDLFAPP